MTTTKTPTGPATRPKAKHEPTQQDLQTAYGEMAMSSPWVPPVSPLATYQPEAVGMPPVAAGAPPAWFAPTNWPW
jgi:hypothetical protein